MRILIFLLALSTCFFSCEKEESSDYESYRYELWKQLVNAGHNFDFIGTQVDDQNYEEVNGLSFDREHEGIGGIETAGVLANLPEVLLGIDAPDIVLLCIGGNDLLDGGLEPAIPLANLPKIIDLLQADNPLVTVFLEQIAPADQATMTPALQQKIDEYNVGIVSVATNETDSLSSIIVVDMSKNWKESYFADPVHYNNEGAKEVATRYFNAMQSSLRGPSIVKILPLGDSRVEG